MKYITTFLISATASAASFAGIAPSPGPEFGESSMGLVALALSAAVYGIVKFKNRNK